MQKLNINIYFLIALLFNPALISVKIAMETSAFGNVPVHSSS